MGQDTKIMQRYIDPSAGETVVEVRDLSFLRDPSHPYGWLRRHWFHHRLKWILRHSDCILAADEQTAFDIHRFYFIPSERIAVRP